MKMPSKASSLKIFLLQGYFDCDLRFVMDRFTNPIPK